MEERKLTQEWGTLLVSGSWQLHIDPRRGFDLLRQADRNRYFVMVMRGCEHNKIKLADLYLCGSLNEAMGLLASRPVNELDKVILYGQYWFIADSDYTYHNVDLFNPDARVVQLFDEVAPALTDDILHSLDQIKQMEEGNHIIKLPHGNN